MKNFTIKDNGGSFMRNLSKRDVLLKLKDGQITSEEAMRFLKELKANNTEYNPRVSNESNTVRVQELRSQDIAVIGISGCFPDARNVEDFWTNIVSGKNSVREIPKERWDIEHFYDPNPKAHNKSYSKWAGLVNGVDFFDPSFFNISPREAQLMDPQQRLFLQETWRALEDAGYSDRELQEKQCGVFVGCDEGDYQRQLEDAGVAAEVYSVTGKLVSILASRISYFLNLKGPSIAINTACSSSLVAIHLACQSINSGTCDLAIAGGVNIITSPAFQIWASKVGMLSPTGKCKTFDNDADGFAQGECAAAVVLKPVESALRDGDYIYAVIKGSEINQDGKTNGISAPSAKSQMELEGTVYNKYGINPETISYIETHGTGTKLGDPIEFNALKDAFRRFTDRNNFCALGSVKTNIGHALAGGGVAGFIKTVLCLNKKKLVPSLNFTKENEHINIGDSPFYINTTLKDWNTENGKIRRAAISAFGFSGTNCHMILDEFIQTNEDIESKPKKPWYLALFSAKTSTAVNERLTDFENWLNLNPSTNIAEIAYNLHRNRSHFPVRVAFVVQNTSDLKEKIAEYLVNTANVEYINKSEPDDRDKLEKAIKMLSGKLSKTEYKKILENLAQMYTEGFEIDWRTIYKDENYFRIPLPTYPFAKESYWISANTYGMKSQEENIKQPEENPEFKMNRNYSIEENTQDYIVRFLSHELNLDKIQLDIDRNIQEYGVDSITVTKLMRNFEERFEIKITGREVLEYNTIKLLSACLSSKIVELKKEVLYEDSEEETKLQINENTDMYPLSEGQKGLWMLQKMSPAMAAYNLPLCFRISQRLEVDKFKQACSFLVKQHPILANIIIEKKGVPYQTAQPLKPLAFEHEDISRLKSREIIPYLKKKLKEPFSLEEGPLMRIHLLTQSENEHIVLIVIHHIIFDGGSLLPFMTTLINAYRELVQGNQPVLALENASYNEFVDWEQKLLTSKEGEGHCAYWKKQLSGNLPVLEIPTDQQRPFEQSFEGQVYTSILSSELSNRLKSFSKTQHVKLSVIFLGILKVLLYRYTGQEDIIVGMPTMGRNKKSFESQIGYFINMIAIRSQRVGKDSFLQLLNDLQMTMADAMDHSTYPFPALVRELKVQRTPGNSPVFQVAYFYQNILQTAGLKTISKSYQSQLSLEFLEGIHQEGEYEFALEVLEQEEKFLLNLKFNPNLFQQSTITRLMGHFNELLTEVMEDPGLLPGDYSMLPEEEKNVLLNWNQTESEYPKDKCIHQLFEKQVQKIPDAIAVVYEGASLTYRELDEKSTKLAIYLQKQGVHPDCLVGICVDRSLEMIIGLLGILKAGGAYVPLDPDYPSERLKYMLKDSGVSILLTQSHLMGKVSQLVEKQCMTIGIDSGWASIEAEAKRSKMLKNEVNTDNLAYVIYTSGSTGNPKGVMIPHLALTNFLISMGNQPGISSEDKLLAVTTYCFDIAGLELYLPLVNGARVYICSSEKTKNVEKLKQEIHKVKPTIMQATPVTWTMLFQAGWKNEEHMRILCGGEALPEKLKDQFIKTGSDAWNMFGPTETTIWSTLAQIRSDEPITIGKPISNTRIYILDQSLKRTPIGVPGELCIAGDGLARGYFNKPQLTAEKFIPNPDKPEAKLYRTGDMARLKPDGNIEFLGRTDHQIKLRGYRIELGEIESRLSRHPDINNSVVIAKEQNGIKQLIAYYIRKNKENVKESPSSQKLREFLKADLPDYMIPVVFIEIESIPLTLNGKVDRKELMRLEVGTDKNTKISLSQSKIEEKILQIWRETLHNNEIGTQDKFFDVGGDSLSAMAVVENTVQELNCNINVTTLFKYSNIKELSAYISEEKSAYSVESIHINQEPELNNFDADALKNTNCTQGSQYPEYLEDSLAIVGISCRFPGAKNQFEFWDNLRSGKESIRFFSEEELRELELSEKIIKDPNYVPIRSTIEGKDLFDPGFFNISPRDAELMDPQFRMLLMHSWKAIEDAGYVSKQIPETGVFISASNSFYQALLMRNSSALYEAHSVMENSDEYVSWLLTQGGTIPTMISHKLGLKGPSYFVHSNCSSSMIGLYSASKSLLSGEAKYALVGASTISPFSRLGYLHQSGLNFSSDGHLKAFDNLADGMVGGEGVAVILLKKAIDAVCDRDNIYAFVRGISINNDGADKVGFYAPSVKGQAEVIGKVLKASNINPESISYVEAHGTGTKLGDPIEFAALCDVYREYTDKKQFCGLGSVKTNIGHLDTAAGLAGCIKVALSLYHNEIPPSINYHSPNANIDLKNSPFYITDKLSDWGNIPKPHRAALSSFGIGGTNAHTILEQCCCENESRQYRTEPVNNSYIIPISAKNSERLKVYVEDLVNFLKQSCSGNSTDTLVLEKSINNEIIDCFSEVLDVNKSELDDDQSFDDLNIDYFRFNRVQQHLSDVWEISIDPEIVIHSHSIVELTQNIVKNYGKDLEKYYSLAETASFDRKDINLADIAYTFQVGREAMESRVAFVANNVRQLIDKLEAFIDGNKKIEGCISGEVKQASDIFQLFEEDQDIGELINKWISKGNLRKLAELWVIGVQLDWGLLYTDKKNHRISLPTYPFAEEHYSVSEIDSKQKFLDTFGNLPQTGFIHPLMHQNTSNLYQQRFSSTFTGQEFFLADHVIGGHRVLPGVAYLEMARAAVDQAAGTVDGIQTVTKLKNVIWVRPITVDGSEVKVHISLYPEDNDKIAYEVYSESDENSEILHSSGIAILDSLTNVPALDLPALQARCTKNTLTSSQCYEMFESTGTSYGPGHSGIETLYVGEGQVLAKLALPSCISATKDQFVLHPSLMDAALQAPIGLMIGPDGLRAGLPFAMEELEIISGCTPSMWALIRYSEGSKAGDKVEKLDIDLCDDQGNVCIRMKGYSSRILELEETEQKTVNNVGTIMFEPVWREKDISEGEILSDDMGHLVIFCEQGNISEQVIKDNVKGTHCITLKTQEQDLAERYQYYALQLFEEIQGILRDKPQGRLLIQVVVKSGKDHQLFSALSAILKTSALENPKLIGQLIEVDSEEDLQGIMSKLRENRCNPIDKQVCYKDGKRMVLAWNEIQVLKQDKEIPWKDRGVYLITGGAGGLGIIFATEMARKAKDITVILTGRSQPSDVKRDRFKELEGLGAKVEYKQIDVTQKEAVFSLIQNIQKEFGSLQGIIHGAGVIHDNFIIKKTTEEFHEVLNPKVAGLVNLDNASKDIPLDFFICFSSGTGVIGNIGQADYAAANSFMDAYARYRNSLTASKQRSGQTLSINWPLWKYGGMHVNQDTEKVMLENTGMIPMETEAGIQVLYQSLASSKDHVLVLNGNMERIKNFHAVSFTSSKSSVEKEKSNIVGESLKEQAFNMIKEILAKAVKLSPAQIKDETSFEKYGIDSILQVSIIQELEKITGELPKTLLFEYTNVRELLDYLVANHSDKLLNTFDLKKGNEIKQQTPKKKDITSFTSTTTYKHGAMRFRNLKQSFKNQGATKQEVDDIAIIGISGRYPLSSTLEEFWEHLKTGKNCIIEAPSNRWITSLTRAVSGNENIKTDKKYYGGFLNQIDYFDYNLFDISKEQVWELSPEIRLFLEIVWETFEDAGYTKSSLQELQTRYQKGVGVYVGTMYNQYPWSIPSLDQAVISSNGSDWQIANRASHFFNLTGPSMAVGSACSSSLTAIHLACESLKQHNCSMALVGGINLTLDPSKYAALKRTGFLGSGDQSKSFGTGDGYIPGEGVGAVLLKPLSMAVKDGDRILGVIKSSFTNHSGGRQMYSAPDPKQQTKLITESISLSGIDPTTIGYLECAANGSQLGDPIEVIALKNAFAQFTDKTQFCALGAVKSNIGHLEAASGISQLSKVVLQFKHRMLLPTINAEPQNPNIKLDNSAFYLQKEFKPWSPVNDAETGEYLPLRSMINSIGAGGSYTNIIVEEYIGETQEKESGIPFPQDFLFTFSAKTEWSLMKYLGNMKAYLKNKSDVAIGDLAYTLQRINHNLERRAAIVASSIEELSDKLGRINKSAESLSESGIYLSTDSKDLSNIDSSAVQEAVEGKDVKILALYWAAAVNIDISKLYDNYEFSLIDMPKYCFEHKFEFNFSNFNSIMSNEPKFDYNINPEVYVYDEPYLKDHTVYGEQVLIGVTHGSLALNAFYKIFPQESSVHLHKLTFIKPIEVKKGQSVEVLVEPIEKESAIDFQVKYRYDWADKWDLTATGSFKKSYLEGKEIDIAKLQDSFEEINLIDLNFAENPIVKEGASYKLISHIYRGDDQVLARVSLSQTSREERHEYALHPLIPYSAFQAVAALLKQDGFKEGSLPFGIKDIYLRKTNRIEECWLLVTLVKDSEEMVIFDVDVINDNSQVMANLCGCSIKRIRSNIQTPLVSQDSRPLELERQSGISISLPVFETIESADDLPQKIQKYLTNKLGKIINDHSKLSNPEANLMDMGMESTQLVSMTNEIEKDTKIELYPTLFFEYPNIKELTEFFSKEHRDAFIKLFGGILTKESNLRTQISQEPLNNQHPQNNQSMMNLQLKGKTDAITIVKPELSSQKTSGDPIRDDIAIIGIQGMFADASNLEEFWSNLYYKKDVIKEIPVDHWDYRPWFDANQDAEGKIYCKWGSFIDDVDKFDAGFFNISPREAEGMDPQLRLMIQSIYRTGEDAGYISKLRGSSTGVFIGVCNYDYLSKIQELNLPPDPVMALNNSVTGFANRISFLFDFKGPSNTIDTACSSSLTSLHYACNALRNKECDMAFVGGANLLLASSHYRYFSSIKALSPTGRCHTFDEAADGYIPGECIGSVLLKPLQQAIKDGDRIYAVIKGTAALHGGYTPSFTAPSVEGEENVILKAWEDAGINPETISYIEAHGTGTKLGDPIEINSLKRAFQRFTGKEHFCAVGSVKANIGHTEGAAGIASMLKVILQMKHRVIPAMPKFEKLNPYIQLNKSPLYINQEAEEWQSPAGVPRRAGVSSFGISGAYAHVVLEEYAENEQEQSSNIDNTQKPVIVLLSAKNEDRLKERVKQLLTMLKQQSVNLVNLAYTLQVGRDAMEERLGIAVSSVEDLKEKLQGFVDGREDINDLYRGQVKRNRETLGVFAGDEDMQKTIEIWMDKGKHLKLLDLWVKGLNFDWSRLYAGIKPRRISLPTYPFARESYWVCVDNAENTKKSVAGKYGHMISSSVLHPLLHQNTSNFNEQSFKTTFTGQEFFFVNHVIKGYRVLPGVTYLEMAREAIVQSMGVLEVEQPRIRMKNVVWIRPIAVNDHIPDDQMVEINIGLYPENDGQIFYEVYSEAEDDMEPVIHSQGVILLESEFSEVTVLNIENLLTECTNGSYSAAQWYGAIGTVYGPGFQGVEMIYQGKEHLLAKLSLPESVADTWGQFVLHPSIMDSAVQVALISSVINTGEEALPFALEELEILGDCSSEMWALVRDSKGSKEGDKIRKFDIDLCDEQGRICVRMKGLSSRVQDGEIGTIGSTSTSKTLFFEPVLKEQRTSEKEANYEYEQHLVILCEPDAITQKKIETKMDGKAECFVLNSEHKGIAERFELYTVQVFEKIQSILKEKPQGNILIQIVIEPKGEKQVFSGLLGLIKTARLESTKLICELIEIDFEEDTDLIASKLLESSQTPDSIHICYQDDHRLVGAWRELEAIC